MKNEEIQHILNKIIKEKYPEIDVEIYVSNEPDMTYVMSFQKKEIYNIFFHLSDDDYGKYVREGMDKPMWDNIRELIRDLMKMLGISDKVKFYFNYGGY